MGDELDPKCIIEQQQLALDERWQQLETAMAKAAALDARLSEEQARSAKLEAQLSAMRNLLAQWQTDWRQEPKTRLAEATAQALGAR